jgi:hypothetical protein
MGVGHGAPGGSAEACEGRKLRNVNPVGTVCFGIGDVKVKRSFVLA